MFVSNAKHSLMKQPLRRRSPRSSSSSSSSSSIRASAATKVSSGRKTTVSFSLPYRCHFGQQMCMLGKGSVMGDWSVNNAVEMRWTSGDVWVAEVEITDTLMKDMEYKYVVRDSNGQVNRWMDGNNVTLQIPAFLSNGRRGGTIQVSDSWDQSSHDVSISFEGVPSMQPREVEIEIQRFSPPASSSGREADSAKPNEPSTPPAYDNEMAVLQSSIERALNDLSVAMDQSDDMVDSVKDPAHPNVLEVDRKVAASYNRVMALSKALKASATDLRLPQPPRSYSQTHRPMSWRFDRVPIWVR